jgi:hypothetical protein
MCSLMHISEDQKRLGFLNPTQTNQLELNIVVNEKSEMFKRLSNKKLAAAIKKHNKNCPKRKEILHQPT